MLPSDNAAAACKNGVVGKFLAVQTSAGFWESTTLSCLRVGHSHEDVDACFGVLSKILVASGDLQCPQDVAQPDAWPARRECQ